jgi:ribosome-associated protein
MAAGDQPASPKRGELLDSTELAHKIVDVLSEKKGIDILLLDVRQVSLLADYFIVCSGEVDRHLQALADEVGHTMKALEAFPLHGEGDASSGWVLLDYGDVVVHLFTSRMREFYRLEELWKDAHIVVRVQ